METFGSTQRHTATCCRLRWVLIPGPVQTVSSIFKAGPGIGCCIEWRWLSQPPFEL